MGTFWVVCKIALAVLGYVGMLAALLFGGTYLLGRIWRETEEGSWEGS